MAEYSKEYVLQIDWQDFSIFDEYNKLEDGYYISMICEGFGFIAIAKFDNICYVAVPNKNDDEYKWLRFCFETKSITNDEYK